MRNQTVTVQGEQIKAREVEDGWCLVQTGCAEDRLFSVCDQFASRCQPLQSKQTLLLPGKATSLWHVEAVGGEQARLTLNAQWLGSSSPV